MENQDYVFENFLESNQETENLSETENDNLDIYLEKFFVNNVGGIYEILYCGNTIYCSNLTICQ